MYSASRASFSFWRSGLEAFQAARHERCGNFGEIGGGVDLGGGSGDAVEVSTHADVFDACNFDYVIEVVDKRVERGAADSIAVSAVDLIGDVEGNR